MQVTLGAFIRAKLNARKEDDFLFLLVFSRRDFPKAINSVSVNLEMVCNRCRPNVGVHQSLIQFIVRIFTLILVIVGGRGMQVQVPSVPLGTRERHYVSLLIDVYAFCCQRRL